MTKSSPNYFDLSDERFSLGLLAAVDVPGFPHSVARLGDAVYVTDLDGHKIWKYSAANLGAEPGKYEMSFDL